MDFFSYVILVIMVMLGIMVMTGAIIMFLVGIAKKHSIWTKLALGSITMYAFFVVTIIGLDALNRVKYDNIQFVTVDDNKITILNRGNSEMGSYVRYAMNKENILEFDKYPKYTCHLDDKHGVTYNIINSGELYVVIFENDYDDWSYADVYHIVVDNDKNASVQNVEHISPIDDFTITQSRLIEKYNFTYDDLNSLKIQLSE